MINASILSAPTPPAAADPAFFDFEKKYAQVERTLAKARKAGVVYFLAALILLLAPALFVFLTQLTKTGDAIFATVFFIGLFLQVFVFRACLTVSAVHFRVRESVVNCLIWLPLISAAQMLIALIALQFELFMLFMLLTAIEIFLTIQLSKLEQPIEISQCAFFADNLWESARKAYALGNARNYAYQRALKVREIKEQTRKEVGAFRFWWVLMLYPVIIFVNVIFASGSFDKNAFIVSALVLGLLLCLVLFYQILAKRFEVIFLLIMGLLAAVHFYILFISSNFVLSVVDVFFLGASLTLIYRYFSKLHHYRGLSYNLYDLVELLDADKPEIVEFAHKTLIAETGYSLAANRALWMSKISAL